MFDSMITSAKFFIVIAIRDFNEKHACEQQIILRIMLWIWLVKSVPMQELSRLEQSIERGTDRIKVMQISRVVDKLYRLVYTNAQS